jgi:hypothetical protein
LAQIISDVGILFTDRAPEVRNLLSPLLASQSRFHCGFEARKVNGGRVLVAHDNTRIGESYRDWTFRTFAKNFWCKYFELWKQIGQTQEWYLERAYLTILRPDIPNHDFDEYLCIHCDPNDLSAEPFGSYKRGPHLHVEMAEAPIPDCHFPLNLGHLQEVLSSVNSLTEALRQAVEVLSHEFLARC